MSHGTHINESRHIYQWVTSHVWKSHATHTKESCHTYEWVMSHAWLERRRTKAASRDNSSRCSSTKKQDPSHIWMSHVTHMNTIQTIQYRQFIAVSLDTKTSHVPHLNESRHTYQWVTSHVWKSHLSGDAKRQLHVTIHCGVPRVQLSRPTRHAVVLWAEKHIQKCQLQHTLQQRTMTTVLWKLVRHAVSMELRNTFWNISCNTHCNIGEWQQCYES